MAAPHAIDDELRRAGEILAALGPPGAAPPWETFADVAPVLGREVGHAFATIMGRPGLDLRTRELTTVCVLAAMGGTEPQLAFHIGGAMRAGATAAEIIEALTQVSVYAGIPRALNAVAVAREVFAEHGASATVDPPRAIVSRLVDALGRGDWDAAAGLLAPDATCLLPAGPVAGRDAIAAALRALAGEWGIERLEATEPLLGPGTALVPATLAFAGGRRAELVVELHVDDGAVGAVRAYGAGLDLHEPIDAERARAA
jgi:4-carboxymuconolactone decarboxylase